MSTRIEREELYPASLVPAIVALAWEGFQKKRKTEATGVDGFPVLKEDPAKEIHLLLNDFIQEGANIKPSWELKADKLPSWKKLLAGDARQRGRTFVAAAARVAWFWKYARQWSKDWKSWVYEDKGLRQPLGPLMRQLADAGIQLTAEELLDLAKLLSGPQGHEMAEYIPARGLVKAIEAAFKDKPILTGTRKELLSLLLAFSDNLPDKESFVRLGALLVEDSVLEKLLEQICADDNYACFRPVESISAALDLISMHLERNPPSERLRAGLIRLRQVMEQGPMHKAQQREIGRINALLGGAGTEEIEPGEAWANQARADFDTMERKQQQSWEKLIAHCLAAESSKPTKKWLATANELVDTIGRADFKASVMKWFPLVALPRPEHQDVPHEHAPDPDLLITDRNGTILKGLAWSCAGIKDTDLSRALSELAEICFKKVRWLGPRCPRVGNACLYSLSSTASNDAAAQLSRLDQTVKQPTAKKRIDKSLNKAAELTGQTREDLEESTVPTFGLDAQACLKQKLGDFTAEFHLEGTNALELLWRNVKGKLQKAVPAEVKSQQPDALKKLKRTIQDIEMMLPAQRNRLERLLLSGRTWNFAQWRERYLDHPLVSGLVRRLIWRFQLGEQRALGISHDNKLVDVTGKELGWLTKESTVQLWHPLGSELEVVAAWRRRFEEQQVVQPFKQAHREIYVLTDAELETETYSNRFAAHIIRQHQFAALAKDRGWKYALMGNFDFQSTPTLVLPQFDLAVEFWVDPTGEVWTDATEMGIALYLATDQVRFLRRDQPVPLHDIPALVFSEVMRDVDLFVSVCSVGNDPQWRDRGEIEAGIGYWERFSFGELSTTAHTRRDVLTRLIPKLKIAPQCSFTDKALIVKGKLRTYKIHFASGNIQMEPNNQYLCIVPARGPSAKTADKVLLPFEGDTMLSIILSKAFMLADDEHISDKSILSQIRGK